MLIQKTVTILRKECPSNASRSSLSRKLVLVPAGLLHHQFHIRSPKAEIEDKEDTELCTSQAFVDCSTMYTILLLLNINIFLGRGSFPFFK